MLELAMRHGQGPTSVSEIASKRAIPPRFLELIFGELRQGGFVISRRGARGGYTLAAAPAETTAGDIIRFVEGPLGPIKCVTDPESEDCPLLDRCGLMEMWQEASRVLNELYDSYTLEDLADRDRRASGMLTYQI